MAEISSQVSTPGTYTPAVRFGEVRTGGVAVSPAASQGPGSGRRPRANRGGTHGFPRAPSRLARPSTRMRAATLHLRADVAELVDAHGSGPCGGNPVEVQVLSSAPQSWRAFAGCRLQNLCTFSAQSPRPARPRRRAAP